MNCIDYNFIYNIKIIFFKYFNNLLIYQLNNLNFRVYNNNHTILLI